ncbi:MAG: subclass B3 metallo-beta-lactamase [Bacteroidetes bacterium 43-93]|nr:subclass B3 metallo-beta-lactamase [Bacteroidota bacterium]OJW97569.1 MAG: subclass B3 metallo-beta-lactamase [Bacteroidetes bacterium 43-93]
MKLRALMLTGCLLTAGYIQAQTIKHFPTLNKEWTQDMKPFRIAGNLYYVGTYDLASYLITTPEGHILINTGTYGSAEMIKRHVQRLGFKFSDIKVLLLTHAHYDHAADIARVKQMTHAKLMVNAQDAGVIADGGLSDFEYGKYGAHYTPVTPDVLLYDGDTIKLGGMNVVMLHHPGHTKGASSFLFDVKDEHRSYRVLIANMPSILDEYTLPSMVTYPNIGKDYGYTLEAMKHLQFDIWLASHASQVDLHKKHKDGDPYNPDVFIDHAGYDAALQKIQETYDKKMGG